MHTECTPNAQSITLHLSTIFHHTPHPKYYHNPLTTNALQRNTPLQYVSIYFTSKSPKIVNISEFFTPPKLRKIPTILKGEAPSVASCVPTPSPRASIHFPPTQAVNGLVIIFFETLGLYLTGSNNTLAYCRGRFARLYFRKVLEWNRTYFASEVYAVYKNVVRWFYSLLYCF